MRPTASGQHDKMNHPGTELQFIAENTQISELGRAAQESSLQQREKTTARQRSTDGS